MVNMKLQKSDKDPELYYYFTAKGEKRWKYRHRYSDALGNRKEKSKSSFKDEKTALRALLNVRVAILNGQSKQVENDKITVAEWFDRWFESNKDSWKESTQAIRERYIRIYFKPYLGKYILQKLDKSTYQTVFIKKIEKNLKFSTVKSIHNVFKIGINAAIEEEILDRNRFNKVKFSSASKETVEELKNYFSPAQLNQFLHAAKYENITSYSCFLTLAYTGLRKGELCGLQWNNVDFKNKTITVQRTRDTMGSRSPKTKNSYRTFLIDDVLVSQLKMYQTWCKETMLRNGIKFNENQFVFIEKNCDPLRYRSILSKFKRIARETNLPEHVTVHGLRHTHATILLNSELNNVVAIAERLGNTVDMIQTVYGHIMKDLERKTVNLFAESVAYGGNLGASSS